MVLCTKALEHFLQIRQAVWVHIFKKQLKACFTL